MSKNPPKAKQKSEKNRTKAGKLAQCRVASDFLIPDLSTMYALISLRPIRSAVFVSLVLFFSWAPMSALANCSRVINVPVSPTGLSVITAGATVHGIFPDLLRRLGAKYGCTFAFPVVPRARQEAMFEAGTADLLVTSIQTGRRDALGEYVPMLQIRATLISLASKRSAISNMRDLVNQRDLRLVLVRGYDYGPDYQKLVSELGDQGRVFLEPDPTSVARILYTSPDRATIMAPSIFTGAIGDDARFTGMLDKLRFEALEELPWSPSGTYISKTSLNAEDKILLLKLLQKSANSGEVWRAYQRHYSAKIVKLSLRPLDRAR